MSPDRLSLTFSALADPTRRAILLRLSSGRTTVSALAEPHDMSLPAISKHLKVLERCGLITRSRIAQERPCHLNAEPMKEAVDWLERYREHWEQSLDRLDNYLQVLQGKKPAPAAGAGRLAPRLKSVATAKSSRAKKPRKRP
ncbi:MAG: winged helix-turn-helix transcriptional regulator [Opitutae bacterium]|nr:winged helix-turn-helix transcriptional regulator [Opitutae bacterium]